MLFMAAPPTALRSGVAAPPRGPRGASAAGCPPPGHATGRVPMLPAPQTRRQLGVPSSVLWNVIGPMPQIAITAGSLPSFFTPS